MSLPRCEPGSAGLSARRLAVADGHIEEALVRGVYPAAVFAVVRKGKIAHIRAFGSIGEGRPTRSDTIFDLASVTKPNAAAALLTLVEDGKANLIQTVQDWIPEAAGTAVGPLTIRLLATHSSGLPPWKALYQVGGSAAQLKEILATPLRNPPGEKYAYSDLGYILLGEIVARASGMSLDLYLHSRVFAPLGMTDTGYLPAREMSERIAPTANSRDRTGQQNVGIVHDENANAAGGVSGHAGLFGTAPDLCILAAALAGNGSVLRHRLFGRPTLELVRNSQIPPEVGGHSIGWFTPPNTMLPRGDLFSGQVFGHTGFTGTMVVIVPSYELAVVLLTNRVMNPADGTEIAKVRRRVMNAVASAVEA